jgi:hypothetical protein
MLGIAQSTDQRDPITLSDPHVEHSIVIRATLDILYDHEIESFMDDKLYHHVIEFAQKWDMPIISRTIVTEFRSHANTPKMFSTINPMFRLSVDIGDHDLIAAMVRSCHGNKWLAAGVEPADSSPHLPPLKLALDDPIVNFEAERYLKGAPVFHLGGWPYAKFAALPTPLAWAILRAQEAVDLAYKSSDSEALSLELKRVLDSMCELRIPSLESNTWLTIC